MVRTVNIEVYCDETAGERDIFAVVSEHRTDLPNPFDEQLQRWATENFADLEAGETVAEAGEFVYEPDGEIIEFRKAR